MSNFTSRLPISTTTTQTWTGQFNVALIYWYKPLNIGDTVSVRDSNGHQIWQGACESANGSQVFSFIPFPVDGINVNQISSGTLFIYLA